MVLLVIDTQKGITDDRLFEFERLKKNIKELIALARENGKEVIFVQHDDGPGTGFSVGDEEFEIFDEFAPSAGEKIFIKDVNSALHPSVGLLDYLRPKKETTIMVVGLQTNFCIDATIKSGFDNGFEMIVPEYTNSTFNNDYMSGEATYRYYNEMMWPGRFAKCVSMDEAKDLLAQETVVKGNAMKTLYLECNMGAAGDMITAALSEIVDDPEASFAKLNALGIPGVTFSREKAVKYGITGTYVSVKVNGEEEDEYDAHHHDHEHEHEHEHHHDHDHHHDHEHSHDHEHHHHRSLADVEHIVRGHMNLPEDIQDEVMDVYKIIAEAESHVHGTSVSEIHFHEVGTMDAIADITAACMLMREIAPDEVIVSPVHVGCGEVKCAHGILPVPAPATAYILRDVPIYGGKIRGELCTPTGAALLKHFATRFGDMPILRVKSIGYGIGKKDFGTLSAVRAMLGETD